MRSSKPSSRACRICRARPSSGDRSSCSAHSITPSSTRSASAGCRAAKPMAAIWPRPSSSWFPQPSLPCRHPIAMTVQVPRHRISKPAARKRRKTRARGRRERIMSKPTIPGPDPDTRTPKFRLPPLACDAHSHIFGPGDKYPYAEGRPYTPPDAPLEDFRTLLAKLGIGRAVIVNASVHGTDNRVALDAIAVSNGTFRAVANIDDSIAERGLRELHEGGFRGCRFNFVRHLGGVPDMAVFHRIGAMVAPWGWHIDLHLDAIDLPEYAGMLAKLPVRYAIDHMGRVKASDGLDQLPFRTLIELMTRDEKRWVKVCE